MLAMRKFVGDTTTVSNLAETQAHPGDPED